MLITEESRADTIVRCECPFIGNQIAAATDRGWAACCPDADSTNSPRTGRDPVLTFITVGFAEL